MLTKIFLATLWLTLTIFLISLGFWQLDRADEKKAIKARLLLASQQKGVVYNNQESLDNKVYHKLLFTGYYDSARQFIYDNQIYEKKAGYYVLTPFYLDDSSQTLLVNRGFVAWGLKRQLPNDFALSDKKRTIEVSINKPIVRPTLKELESHSVFPILIQVLDLEKIAQTLGVALLPVVGQLESSQPDGFIRQWKAFYGSVDKHIGYAIQWFLMALALFVLSAHTLKASIKNKRKKANS